ncbi:uncharacterized protein LAESUDRAFT_718139 [Laetiporus sulphureus 93-53]|uniref:Uncharacterized protein n=1 Tax=Laetiporus sulphureus 93-53 TaxID=1314785 RepID=A0A165B8C5_9APHY|nr:uncharacterized protein LAESUDRAFT_718139 [Laetiporus sulphureus 93-53]KZT00478.1 hypothetical protein LAESUDRAFT_718139 [Laetiporus sulphureus 93-53]
MFGIDALDINPANGAGSFNGLACWPRTDLRKLRTKDRHLYASLRTSPDVSQMSPRRLRSAGTHLSEVTFKPHKATAPLSHPEKLSAVNRERVPNSKVTELVRVSSESFLRALKGPRAYILNLQQRLIHSRPEYMASDFKFTVAWAAAMDNVTL